MNAKTAHLMRWWFIFIACLAPLPYIVYRLVINNLGAEPAKALVEFLGETSLIVLFVTLAVTPLSKVKVLPSFVKYRRMLGLWVFFYACLHLLSYGVFLVDWRNFIEDLYQRPYVIVGALAFLILLALAVTSPRAAIKKLGKKWKLLHRWVYLATFLVVVHVYWQLRADYFEALVYFVIFLVLMSFRLDVLLAWKSRAINK